MPFIRSVKITESIRDFTATITIFTLLSLITASESHVNPSIGIVESSSSIVSVSYTHLDVYKRQPLSVAQQVTILFAANEGFLDDIDNKNINDYKNGWFESVSYTHLFYFFVFRKGTL